MNDHVFLDSPFTVNARTDRQAGSHGGVLIATRDLVANTCSILPIDASGYDFICGIIVYSRLNALLIVNVYLPPISSNYYIFSINLKQALELCYEQFEAAVSSLGILHKDFVITGDFNLPRSNWNTFTSTCFREQSYCDVLFGMSFPQVVDKPTHVAGNVLDLVFTTCNVSCIETASLDVSDHFIISVVVDIPLEESINTIHEFIPPMYAFRTGRLNEFCTNLITFNPFFYSSVDEAHDMLYQLLNQLYPMFFKRKRAKRANLPSYYSSHSVHIHNKLQTLIRRKAKPNLGVHDSSITTLKRSLEESTELNKIGYLDSFRDMDSNSAFKYLKHISKPKSLPHALYHDNAVARTDHEKAELFNSYFASVYSDSSPPCIPFVNPRPDICSQDVHFSVDDINSALTRLPDSSSLTHDNLPASLLKSCSYVFAPIFYVLFYFILSSCKFPACWKTAIVTPVFKKGDCNQTSNYRPVSLLPRISLVFERILFNFIYPKIRHKLRSEQYGFRPGRSIVLQMIAYLDAIHNNFDNNIPSCAVYFDFSKAFDLMPHNVLLNKLASFGFDDNFIKLFTSYLSNRYQIVKVNHSFSSPRLVSSGVPQGSALGPLLFLLFINDLPLSCSSNCFSFADDSKILNNVSQLPVIQDDIHNLSLWCQTNGMKFNVNKCFCIVFSNRNVQVDLSLNNDTLSQVSVITDLGLTIDSNLNRSSNCFLFADDSKILNNVSQLPVIQDDIHNLSLWCQTNGMKFNVNKCFCIVFSNRNVQVDLSLNNDTLSQVSVITDLGLTIDSNLRWGSHSENRLHNALKSFFSINVPASCPLSTKLTLYRSMVLSVLLSASQAWWPQRSYLVKFERFNKKVLRWICNNYSLSYIDCCRKLSVFPVTFYLQFYDLIFFCKLVNNFYNFDVFQFVQYCRNFGTRNDDYLLLEERFPVSQVSKSNYFNRIIPLFNYLTKQYRLDFSSPGILKSRLVTILSSHLETFDIHNTCSYFIKCPCSTCKFTRS